MPRHLIIASILLLVIGLAGLTLWQGGRAGSIAGGQALIGGPISLVNQHGERVTEKDLAGGFTLVYFGYTFCPDFCPMSLSTMTEALELMAPEQAERITPVFISVDPARDTVEQLADYAPHFHPRLIALTGTDEEIKAAAKAYRIYYNVPPNQDEDYAVDHSTFTYLMGPDGSYLTHFNHSATPEDIAERLRAEVKKG